VFHGAFLCGLLQGREARDILVFANPVSALPCTCLGGRSGIARLEEIQAFLAGRGEGQVAAVPRKERIP
jgi:sugar/nucleoside kinase (ribokinase family)